MMTLLKQSCRNWLDHARGATLSHIEELQGTVVRAANNGVGVFMIKGERAERRGGVKRLLWLVGVIQIPDVGLLGHIWRHLLEAQLGVGGGNSLVGAAVGVPANLGNSALN